MSIKGVVIKGDTRRLDYGSRRHGEPHVASEGCGVRCVTGARNIRKTE